MHYSPNKKAIWMKPADWVEKASDNSKLVIALASEFWEACYPERDLPYYLRSLNYQTCYDASKLRFEETNDTKKNAEKFVNI